MLKNKLPSYRQLISICILALHAAIMLLLGTLLLFFFSYLVLPLLTYQGKSVAVPNLVGSSLTEVEVTLSKQRLRAEISDEMAYMPEYAPMTVLQQHPKPGEQVKKGRKIYLTINSPTPPEVAMPNLVDGSLRNAHTLLQNQGLLVGNVKYVPDLAQDAVLEQYYQRKKIEPGTMIGKGSKVDLVVGAGLSKTKVSIPEVLGMRLEQAKMLLLHHGIRIGSITYGKSEDERFSGAIFKQVPEAGQEVCRGESIDLWLTELEDRGEE